MFGMRAHGLVTQDHTATTGRYDLVAVETKGAEQTEGAGVSSLVKAAQGLGSVLHNDYVPFAAYREQRLKVDGVAKGMHWQAGTNNAPTILHPANTIFPRHGVFI